MKIITIHAFSDCAVPGFVTNQFWGSLLWRARASWGSFDALCYMVLGLMEEILSTHRAAGEPHHASMLYVMVALKRTGDISIN